MSTMRSQTLIDAQLYQKTKAALMAKERELARANRQVRKLSLQVQGAQLPGKQLEAARDNANLLITFAISMQPTSQRFCHQWEMKRSAWQRATHFLLLALDTYPHLYANEAVDALFNDLQKSPKALRRVVMRYRKADIAGLGDRIRANVHQSDLQEFIGGESGRFPNRILPTGAPK